MTAAAVVYALAAIYLPMLTMVMGMVWPVFIALVTIRVGLYWGVLASVASLVLTMLFATPVTGGFFVLSFAPTGLALGWFLRRRTSTVRSFIAGSLASLVGKAAGALLMLALFGLNPFAIDIDLAQRTMDETLAMYQTMGMSEAQITETRTAAGQVMELFVLMLPAFFLGSAVLETGVCIAVLRRVLPRLGMSAAPFPALSTWRLPVFFPYLFAFSLIGIYWGTSRDITWLYQTALNGYIIAFLAGLVEGIALLHFMMERYRVAPILRIIIYVFVLLNGFISQLLAWTGLFDMAFDYRKRIKNIK